MSFISQVRVFVLCLALFFFASYLFLFSGSVTGNTVSVISLSTVNWVGAGIFIIGLFGLWFWLREH
jgi:hypothetical protein